MELNRYEAREERLTVQGRNDVNRRVNWCEDGGGVHAAALRSSAGSRSSVEKVLPSSFVSLTISDQCSMGMLFRSRQPCTFV